MKQLYNWVMHYNPYTDEWSAAKREDYSELFNNRNGPKVIRSKTADGLINSINKLTNNKRRQSSA